MIDRPWPAEWLRGVLELCVLRVLSFGPTYGYAIASALEAQGLGTVKGGSLYPLLGRLEQAGLIIADWRAGESGPGRKFFTLTPAGIDALSVQAELWREFADLSTSLIVDSPDRAAVGGRKDTG